VEAAALRDESNEVRSMRATCIVFVWLVVVSVGCAEAGRTGPAARSATAELKDANGQVVGTAKLSDVAGAVRILLETRDLPPGEKGVHIHETESCEPPTFESAGGHFNPTGRQHGALNPQGAHAGDLPNITVGDDGSGQLQTTTALVSLASGRENSLLDEDGSAIVVHAKADDMRTDPAGNSGDRIACGVIEEG
jgi:Cu-Zn family superoxide dismutase